MYHGPQTRSVSSILRVACSLTPRGSGSLEKQSPVSIKTMEKKEQTGHGASSPTWKTTTSCGQNEPDGAPTSYSNAPLGRSLRSLFPQRCCFLGCSCELEARPGHNQIRAISDKKAEKHSPHDHFRDFELPLELPPNVQQF